MGHRDTIRIKDGSGKTSVNQRISKVVDTLTFIDERLDTLLEAYGGVADSAPVTEEVEDPLLNGPQLEGEGISQDDVDSMFGESESAASADIPPPQPPAGNLSDGAESKNTQAEIDSLFD